MHVQRAPSHRDASAKPSCTDGSWYPERVLGTDVADVDKHVQGSAERTNIHKHGSRCRTGDFGKTQCSQNYCCECGGNETTFTLLEALMDEDGKRGLRCVGYTPMDPKDWKFLLDRPRRWAPYLTSRTAQTLASL